MSATTSIQWTDKTWNPVRGCSIVSPGCVNCYAMKQAHRFSGPGRPYHGLTKQTAAGPQWTGKVVTVEDALLEPLSWRKPARVFVNSMSDLFHEGVPDEFIDRVFAVMALATKHTFQILTKRPQRMRDYLSWSARRHRVMWSRVEIQQHVEAYWSKAQLLTAYARPGDAWDAMERAWPLPNVWLGVSCENQEQAAKRIPLLLQTPAAVHWVSAEPLLGPIDFASIPVPNSEGGTMPSLAGLDWIVVGGESGPGARVFDIQWARDILRQCRMSGTWFFLKQLGANPDNGAQVDGSLIQASIRDRKGGDITEWPEDLRVRDYPRMEVRA